MHGYCWYRSSSRIVILIPSMILTLTYLRSCNGRWSNRGIPGGISVPIWSTCHHCLTSGWSRIIVALVATCLQSNNRNWNYRPILHFPPSLGKPSSLIYITPKIKVKLFHEKSLEKILNLPTFHHERIWHLIVKKSVGKVAVLMSKAELENWSWPWRKVACFGEFCSLYTAADSSFCTKQSEKWFVMRAKNFASVVVCCDLSGGQRGQAKMRCFRSHKTFVGTGSNCPRISRLWTAKQHLKPSVKWQQSIFCSALKWLDHIPEVIEKIELKGSSLFFKGSFCFVFLSLFLLQLHKSFSKRWRRCWDYCELRRKPSP